MEQWSFVVSGKGDVDHYAGTEPLCIVVPKIQAKWERSGDLSPEQVLKPHRCLSSSNSAYARARGVQRGRYGSDPKTVPENLGVWGFGSATNHPVVAMESSKCVDPWMTGGTGVTPSTTVPNRTRSMDEEMAAP